MFLKIFKMKFSIILIPLSGVPLFQFSIIPIFLLCGEIFPQNIEGVNARLDAMGGSAAADDIGWTIGHPASIYKFPNHFQGNVYLKHVTGIGRTYGTAIGIVRFNEFLYAGITYNNKILMTYNFYSEGLEILKYPQEDVPSTDYFPHIPQVNLCLKLNDNIQLGLGGYFEGFSWDHKKVKKLPYDTLVGSAQDTIYYAYDHDDKRVRNNGVNVEAIITIGGLTIYPQILIGFPIIKGREFNNSLSKSKSKLLSSPSASPLTEPLSDLTLTYESKEGLFFRGGSYFWGDIGNTFWKTGIIYINKRFQFNENTDLLTQKLNIDGTVDSTLVDTLYDSIPSDHNWNFIQAFIGFVPSFSDNLYFSPEYNVGFGWYKAMDDISTSTDVSYDPTDTTFYYLYHNLRLGIEKIKESFLFFDEIAFRCGIKAQWIKEWRHFDNFDDVTSSSELSIPWSSYFWDGDFIKKQARVTGGFGLKKGRGDLDISCAWLAWQGQSILTGPSAAMATLTVDFSRRKEF